MHGKMRRMLRWAACNVGEAFRSIVFFHDMENARRVSAKNGYGAIKDLGENFKKTENLRFYSFGRRHAGECPSGLRAGA